MIKKTIVYDNFSKGEVGPALENAATGTFHAKNLIVYSDGLIGPRPGLRNITPENMPNGSLLGLAVTPTPGRDGLFIIGTTAYRFNLFDPSGDTPVSIGSIPNSTGEIVFPELDTANSIATTVTEGAVVLNQIVDTVTDLNSPSGHAHEIYGAQLVLAENTSSPRLWASAIGDFADWSDGFFLDVGDNWQVGALLSQRNSLLVIKRTGIYVVYGQLTNDSSQLSVRRVVGADGVLHPWQVATDSRDIAWFFQFDSTCPSSFNGAEVTHYGKLQFGSKEEDGTAALPPVNRSVVILRGQLTPDTPCFIQGGSSQAMFIEHNGVWSYHEFETPITAMARNAANNLVITDGGGTSTPAKIYSTRFDIDRPGFTSDGLYGAGDGSDTPLSTDLHLPFYFEKEGSVRVRSVNIEIKKWDTGVTSNTLSCVITTLNRPNGAGDVTNTVSTWTEGSSVASTSGDHDRLVFGKFSNWGQGFAVRIYDQSVAIRSVNIEFEVDPNKPRNDNS